MKEKESAPVRILSNVAESQQKLGLRELPIWLLLHIDWVSPTSRHWKTRQSVKIVSLNSTYLGLGTITEKIVRWKCFEYSCVLHRLDLTLLHTA